ncbi:telomeric repeat binding factor a [Trichomycterus rosablanca]|uniref:telomeric repeat binding factor a n=1 Tax=Trichomycterus rosablanca TaxID=2290929 RepID=UPI002F35F13C
MASSSNHLKKVVSDEHIINRWSFDFYVSKAFEAFRNEDCVGFNELRNLIECLVVRPIDGHTDMMIKLRFMQFLSRINDGDKLGVTFQNPLTPLESALSVLECICTEVDVPQKTLEQVHTAIREMLITVCIKSKQFDKAEEMLVKHFPKGMDSVGKKKLFVNLIKRRCSTHAVLNRSSYSEFKQDMLDFIEKLYQIPDPFLIKMVKLSRQGWNIDVGVDIHSETNNVVTEESCTQDRATQSPEPINQLTGHEHHQLSNSKQNTPVKNNLSQTPSSSSLVTVKLSFGKLRAVYPGLADQFSVTIPFSQLEEEVEEEAQQDSGLDADAGELHLRLTATPMEGLYSEEEQFVCVEEEQTEQICTQFSSGRCNTASQTKVALQQQGTDKQHQEYVECRSMTAESSCAHTSSPEKGVKTPGSAVSAVTVAQLVIEDDSQTSELESTGFQEAPSPVVAECSKENPLSSLPVSSTPVRIRRKSALRRSIPSEPEPASPQQPTEPQNCSTPSKDESSNYPSTQCTPAERPQKHTTKNPRRLSESDESAESIIVDSPRSGKQPRPDHRRSKWMDVSGVQEEWSEEESLFPAASTKNPLGSSSSNEKGKRKMWTEIESDWVRQGVARYGEGRWGQIKSAFSFEGRTAVNIKDRWRTMKRLKLA